MSDDNQIAGTLFKTAQPTPSSHGLSSGADQAIRQAQADAQAALVRQIRNQLHVTRKEALTIATSVSETRAESLQAPIPNISRNPNVGYRRFAWVAQKEDSDADSWHVWYGLGGVGDFIDDTIFVKPLKKLSIFVQDPSDATSSTISLCVGDSNPSNDQLLFQGLYNSVLIQWNDTPQITITNFPGAATGILGANQLTLTDGVGGTLNAGANAAWGNLIVLPITVITGVDFTAQTVTTATIYPFLAS